MKPRRNYSKTIDAYTKLAIKVVLASLLIIFIVQWLMQFEAVRDVLIPTERWEGRPLHEP